ncbi:MAG: DUF2249 domain-containing protein [Candidatus Sedimenticola sp. PURPLELP]
MERLLDVSELEPCEPLEQTLHAVASLQPGEYLRVIHRREPNLLYPMIEKSGHGWLCREGGPAGYEIFIWHQDDPVSTNEANRAFSEC